MGKFRKQQPQSKTGIKLGSDPNGTKLRCFVTPTKDKIAELKQKSLSELDQIVGQFIPNKSLATHESGHMSRRRIYSKENTFWGFFYQTMSDDNSCQNVVRKIQAHACTKNQKQVSSSTSAYCQARQKMDIKTLRTVLSSIKPASSDNSQPIMNNRRVIVVDGTGLSMPDTPRNQAVWPQSASQKPGCGFPQMKVCACFNLQTGLMHSYQFGHKHDAERPLLRKQWDDLASEDILLGDAGFMGYYDFSSLLDRGINSVMTLKIRKPIPAEKSVRKLG